MTLGMVQHNLRKLPLLPLLNGKGAHHISRRIVHDVLTVTFKAVGLNGHLATHSLRKSFVQRLYDRMGDIFAVQEKLGHRNLTTTQKYLGGNYASVRETIEEMSLDGGLRSLFGSAVKKETDETLFLELARRGYNDESIGEVVQIG